jgi:hypothetical protein
VIRRVIGRLVFAVALLQATTAEAGQPETPASDTEAEERVLIRVVPMDEQIAARLRAELGLLGFTAVPLELPEPHSALGSDLLDQLEAGSASAAIEIVRSEHRIDLWVADGNTGKALNRRLDLTLDPAQAEPRTIAIAAVELLRASRLELGEEDNGAPPDTDDDPTKQARERERPPRDITLPSQGALSLAPMLGGSPGGFGVTTHIELAGRWAPLERFALRFSLWIPTLGNSIGVSEGRVRMFVGMAFVEPQLRLPGGAKWFHPELGLGLGGAVVGFEGIAQEGLRSTTRIVGGFASHAHLGLGFAVIPRLWIRLDGYVGALVPRPDVKSTTDVTEATWGTPYATGSLGLEIWL